MIWVCPLNSTYHIPKDGTCPQEDRARLQLVEGFPQVQRASESCGYLRLGGVLKVLLYLIKNSLIREVPEVVGGNSPHVRENHLFGPYNSLVREV